MANGQILTDAAFTTLELTNQFVFQDEVFLDSSKNLHCNHITCSEIICDKITTGAFINTESYECKGLFSNNLKIYDNHEKGSDNSYSDLFETMYGTHNSFAYKDGAQVLGGKLNDASGIYSTIVNGEYNEASGEYSVVLGGMENYAHGNYSVSMGKNAFANHNKTFVYNGTDKPLNTSTESQFVVGCNNGLYFKLPKTSNVKTHMVNEGYACWCWCPIENKLCLKTKQNNLFYKSVLPTELYEIKVTIDSNGNTVLINPDNY